MWYRLVFEVNIWAYKCVNVVRETPCLSSRFVCSIFPSVFCCRETTWLHKTCPPFPPPLPPPTKHSGTGGFLFLSRAKIGSKSGVDLRWQAWPRNPGVPIGLAWVSEWVGERGEGGGPSLISVMFLSAAKFVKLAGCIHSYIRLCSVYQLVKHHVTPLTRDSVTRWIFFL